MKYFLPLFLSFLFVGINSFAQNQQDSVKAFLDKSLDIIQKNAINRDSVDWQTLRSQVYQKTNGAATYEDILPIYPYLFERIGDHHGALEFKGKSYYWKSGADSYKNQVVLNAVKKYDSVIVKKIGKNIGYILLPGNNDFGGKHINKDGQAIRDAIAAINSKHIKGWIIDLRVNTGGSMYQMLAGLGGLLGDGKVGGFVNQHQQSDGNWIIKAGNIYIDTTQASNIIDKNPVKIKDIPIAVLISGRTASSGEIIAISTVGRKNTIRIGEKSAGYTTSNQGFKLNAYSGLNLAVDFDTDRTGKVYKNYVMPDILVKGGDDFENLLNDEKVKKACAWLLKK